MLVREPERRGISAGQFEAFFARFCGDVIYEELEAGRAGGLRGWGVDGFGRVGYEVGGECEMGSQFSGGGRMGMMGWERFRVEGMSSVGMVDPKDGCCYV